MNKLLMFPLIFLFLISLYGWMGGGEGTSGTVPLYGDRTIYVTNDTVNQTGGYYVATNATFDTDDTLWVLGILFGAIALGGIITLHIVGNGLGDFSGNVVFQAFVFVGLWGALSVGGQDFLFASVYGTSIWFIITIAFLLGLAHQVSGASSD